MYKAQRSAASVLDTSFLDARARVLDLAAFLDRLDRCEDHAEVANDPRLAFLSAALAELQSQTPGRTERVQRLYSKA